MITLTRGMTLFNKATGDYGVSISAPIEYSSSRQTNISVMIPGARMFSVWHLPDVEQADNPYKALSVGDAARVLGNDGREYTVKVAYISRNATWIVIAHGENEWVYRGSIIAVQPAAMRR